MSVTSIGWIKPLIARFANPASKYVSTVFSCFLTSLSREFQKVDGSHRIASYKHTTGTTAHRNHAFYGHTDLYLREAERLHWPILVKSLKEQLNEGWTLAAIRERLQDPAYHIDLLGTIPNPSTPLPGTGLSPDDHIPDFSIDEMHRQLVRFIVADDQVSGIYF
jgi:hypothetical protein